MATILTPSNLKLPLIGTKGKKKALTLEQMQQAVGGYIEHVYGPTGKLLCIINEEGCYTSEPINEPARTLIAKAFGTSTASIVPIRGNVILADDLGDEMA
jgi:hypothetical protein